MAWIEGSYWEGANKKFICHKCQSPPKEYEHHAMYSCCFRLSCDECDAVMWIYSHCRDNRTKQLRNEWHVGRHHKRHYMFDDTVGNDSDDEDVHAS
jgi:hypothetical protein